MPRALLSVSDKAGLIEFAQGLAALGWDIVASGGTEKSLHEAGLDVVPLSRVTQMEEMLGGRVKTLHPAIHGAILARDTDEDFDALRQAGYAPIDLVVCNLYPFQKVASQPDITLNDLVENIDIGGVTLLRAAAKNFQRVTVLVYPEDYAEVLNLLREQGRVPLEKRRALAVKAFDHTRAYDTTIHAYLSEARTEDDALPESFVWAGARVQELRYGENPHQKAGFFAPQINTAPLGGEVLGGKVLSYNNILDADAAWRAATSFDANQEAAVVIVKHLTPCGIAVGESPEAAFPYALESDPVSAFGGIIAVNQTINEAFVSALGTLFVEVILAPDFTEEAIEKLETGRKNCRLLRMKNAPMEPHLEFRSVLGGVLVQERDNGDPAEIAWTVVTQRAPSQQETSDLNFAWKVVSHVKSNAIVLAKNGATIGIGGGLSSRVDSVRLAVEKAGNKAQGAVMASDAFFPFPDGVESAAAAGVTAIIQPGGSIRDQQVIDAANAAGIAMVFTGVRHFRH